MERCTDVRRITPAEVDMGGTVPLHAWFHWMQILAERHAAQWRIGREQLIEQRLVWVLARLRIEIDRPIGVGESVSLQTYAGQTTRAAYPRFLRMAVNENEVGRVASLWALMNVDDRSLVLPGRTELPFFPQLPLSCCPDLPGRLPVVSGEEHTLLRTPAYGDLDINGHVNNARYPAWIEDALSLQTLNNRYIDTLQVHYRHEILPNTPCHLSVTENVTSFAVACRDECTNTMLFEAAGTLRNK